MLDWAQAISEPGVIYDKLASAMYRYCNFRETSKIYICTTST